jgi:hypothetical protein
MKGAQSGTPEQTKPESQMKNSDRVEVQIPFSGFYESLYSAEIDRFTESDADHFAGEDKGSLAEELRVSADEFSGLLSDALDYKAACLAIAKTYADCFSRRVSKEIQCKLNLKYVDMTSPAYYNFETDKIFCTIPWGAIKRLYRLHEADGFKVLDAQIIKRHSSYDGFRSFYSNDLATWQEKGLENWDHNELGTLLVAAMKLSGWTRDDDLSLYYMVTDDGCYGEISGAMDWPKYEAALAELRAEKEADMIEIDPDYIPPAVRCPNTLDLFKAH